VPAQGGKNFSGAFFRESKKVSKMVMSQNRRREGVRNKADTIFSLYLYTEQTGDPGNGTVNE